MMTRRERGREIATAWLDDYMRDVVCQECGAQPVEWHYEGHPDQPNARVSSLRSQGQTIERIKAEIDKCMPLCRSCHMRVDGRIDRLREKQPRQKGSRFVSDDRPCSCCGKATKVMRQSMCYGCYMHHTGKRLRKRPTCDGCCRSKE